MANSEIVKLSRVCQVGIAVKDADKVVEAWKSAFGFDKWRNENIGGKDGKGRPWAARLVHYQFGPMDFELIQPVEGRIAQSRFLDAYGDGIHHIAFATDDLENDLARFTEKGASIILSGKWQGGGSAYLDIGIGDIIIEIEKVGR